MRTALVLLGLAAAASAGGLEQSIFVVRVTTESVSAGGTSRRTLAAPALPVGPDGLLLAVGFAVNPPAREQREAVKVTAIDPSGRERKARILRGVQDLDCTFFRVSGEAPEPVALEGAPASPGDAVLLLARHGELMRYAPRRRRAQVDAKVTEPRTLYALDVDVLTWAGSIATTPDGRLVGFVDTRPTTVEGTGAMLGVGTRTLVIVAAEVFATAAGHVGMPDRDKAWLGVNLAPFDRDREAYFGVAGDWRGALVTGVAPGSPAAKAGVRLHDLIQSIGPLRIHFEKQTEWDDMLRAVQRLPLGKPLACRVVRFELQKDGSYTARPRDLSLVLEERPIDFDDAKEVEVADLGIKIKPLTQDWRRVAKVSDDLSAVVVTGTGRASPAQLAGLAAGDLVLKVDDKTVAGVTSFLALVDAARKARRKRIVLFVRRGAETRFVAVSTGWQG